jgi:hypothetical protein
MAGSLSNWEAAVRGVASLGKDRAITCEARLAVDQAPFRCTDQHRCATGIRRRLLGTGTLREHHPAKPWKNADQDFRDLAIGDCLRHTWRFQVISIGDTSQLTAMI